MPLNVNELDFDLIKNNIKTYLKLQSEFQDYNFEGSGMSVLLDLLAYATHYMGVYNNMTFNEMFINTAILRNSVVDHALHLGYIPRQETAAKAQITLTIDLSAEGSPPASINVAKGTKFSATNENNENFRFVADADYSLTDIGGQIFQGTVNLVQGYFVDDIWTYDIAQPERFVLTNEGVDVDHFTVTTKETPAAVEIIEWFKYDNIVNVDSETYAYFYKEVENNQVEIYFGNGVIGKELDDGNYVNVNYLVTSGSAANNINVFTLIDNLGGFGANNYTATTIYSSREGDEKETIEHIRHNAPFFYQSQNRAVTEQDYISIINKHHTGIQAINVWGGEENDPPYYGRVMISIKPEGADVLTPASKALIEETLAKYNVTGIIPLMIDPVFMDINLNVYVRYDPAKTTDSEGSLRTTVENAITAHFNENLYTFDGTLKYSDLLADIDDCHPAIFSNYVDIVMAKEFDPSINTAITYSINFNNEIKEGTVLLEWTNSGGDNMSIIDNDTGTLLLYRNGIYVNSSAGVVNYTTGKITLSNFNPYLAAPTTLTVYSTPKRYDVETTHNNILLQGATTVTLSRLT